LFESRRKLKCNAIRMLQKKFEAIEFHDFFDKNFEILKHLELKKIEGFHARSKRNKTSTPSFDQITIPI